MEDGETVRVYVPWTSNASHVVLMARRCDLGVVESRLARRLTRSRMQKAERSSSYPIIDFANTTTQPKQVEKTKAVLPFWKQKIQTSKSARSLDGLDRWRGGGD